MDIKDVYMEGSYFQIPTKLSKDSIDALLLESKTWDKELITGTTSLAQDAARRQSQVYWLPVDHWVAGMMAHLVRSANDFYFRADITNWANPVQYTYYNGDRGDFYGWHIDSAQSEIVRGDIRKLSISLLLSDPDDYEGGELQLHRLDRLETLKPPLGTAIIFSSQTPHRVRPVKSGVRKSLVGWFGGPPWR